MFGFPYAVVKKYGDDDGGRQAALITYYGFLSIFPLLLLGVAVLSRVLADHPDLRRAADRRDRAAGAAVHGRALAATLPTSTVPFVAGLIGLLFSGTGVVFSAYQTLNHVAAVRVALRAGFFSRYVRVFVMLATLLLGALAVGALTVMVTALPDLPGWNARRRCSGRPWSSSACCCLAPGCCWRRPAPFRALWPAAAVGAATVTVVLNLGPVLLARLVSKAGPVYGSFATVAGMFALLYLVSQALVYSAEVAAVRYAQLWPRALDVNRPTAADVRAMTLLAREQERIRGGPGDVPPRPPRFAPVRRRSAAIARPGPARRGSPAAAGAVNRLGPGAGTAAGAGLDLEAGFDVYAGGRGRSPGL